MKGTSEKRGEEGEKTKTSSQTNNKMIDMKGSGSNESCN